MYYEDNHDDILSPPILKTLRLGIEAEKDPYEKSILQIKEAIYLARTSETKSARIVAAEIRKQWRGNEDAIVFIWLWILDAIIEFYENRTSLGVDRLNRAILISKGMKYFQGYEYAAAWQAHFAFVDDKYEDLGRWLLESKLLDADLLETRCRAALILGCSWQGVSQDKQAAIWFEHARKAARTLGDRATIMASIENRAALRLDRLWVQSVCLGDSLELLSQVRVELLGALAYERATKSEALMAQAPVMRIRLAVLGKNYSEALRQIQEMVELSNSDEFSIVRSVTVLKKWLEIQTGGEVEISDDEMNSVATLDNDDAAVCWKFISEIYASQGSSALSEKYLRNSIDCYERYENSLSLLRSVLASSPKFSM